MTVLEISAAAEFALRKKANARAFAEYTRATAMRWTIEEAKADGGLSPRAMRVFEATRNGFLKSAVDAGSTLSGNWANPLSPEAALASDFLASLSGISVFDTMFSSMMAVPIRALVGFVTAGGTGAQIEEGQVKKFSQLTLGNTPIDESKSVAMIAFTKELLKMSGTNATKLFQSELEKGVAKTTDEQFLSILTTGISPTASSGYVRRDLRTAFAAVSGDAQSKYFILMPSATVKTLAFAENEDGSEAFPELGPNGGAISKTPVLPTDAISGKIVVVDASQVAANQGMVETRSAQHASLQFDTTPDSPPTASTVPHSLWQNNQMALMAERYFAAKRIRSAAVAVISNVDYSGNADSPS